MPGCGPGRELTAVIPPSMLQKLKSYIFQELVFLEDPDAFGENDDLLQAGLDSMSIMRLVLFIENEFGVVLPDDELTPENMLTLSRLENWIKRHQHEQT
jgi:D-alanine--poly(phosphoribitol) ligase subunit 2